MTTSAPPGDGVASRRSRRRRIASLVAVAITIALGLASRSAPLLPLIGKYPGDALWAAMIFFAGSALFPGARVRRIVPGAVAFCVAIEMLKWYQAPWIVATRATTLGHLVFGHVFSAANLVAYAVGIALAAAVDRATSALAGRRDADGG